MQTLDLCTSLAPVINLSDIPTLEAALRAHNAKKVRITLENIPNPTRIDLPIRIVEGMEKIADRGTVNKKQAFLVSKLFSLLSSSPVLKA